MQAPSRLQYILAFASIYFIWGSTYIAVSEAVRDIPALIMAGIRYVAAGGLLLLWALLIQRPEKPTRAQTKNAAGIGLFMITLGNGLLAWALHHVPSGMAALLASTGPMLLVLMQWGLKRRSRPDLQTWFGLALGLMGTLLLVGPNALAMLPQVQPLDIAAIFLASIGWNAGSIWSAEADLPKAPILTTGIQMMCGGLGLFIGAGFKGDWAMMDWTAVTAQTWWSMGYLILIGSIIGFSSYVWLIRHVDPVKVSTHTFVNPLVAVVLGWWVAHEPFTEQMGFAAVLMILAVVLLTLKAALIKQFLGQKMGLGTK